MKRLDFKYGRPEKLVDVIVTELKGLKRIGENGMQKFIKMVDIIERCYLDLKRAGLETEMNTATMLSHVEKILPTIQMHKWAIRKQMGESTNFDFQQMLDYLKEERNAMEYIEDDVRHSSIKGKVNAITEVVVDEEGEGSLKEKLYEIVKGLAHVAQLVSSPPRYSNSRSSSEEYNGNVTFMQQMIMKSQVTTDLLP